MKTLDTYTKHKRIQLARINNFSSSVKLWSRKNQKRISGCMNVASNTEKNDRPLNFHLSMYARFMRYVERWKHGGEFNEL